MNIRLHIERLVLEGLALTSDQGRAIEHALRGELANQLRVAGVRESLFQHPSESVIRVDQPVDASEAPAAFGRSVASVISEQLSPTAAGQDR